MLAELHREHGNDVTYTHVQGTREEGTRAY